MSSNPNINLTDPNESNNPSAIRLELGSTEVSYINHSEMYREKIRLFDKQLKDKDEQIKFLTSLMMGMQESIKDYNEHMKTMDKSIIFKDKAISNLKNGINHTRRALKDVCNQYKEKTNENPSFEKFRKSPYPMINGFDTDSVALYKQITAPEFHILEMGTYINRVSYGHPPVPVVSPSSSAILGSSTPLVSTPNEKPTSNLAPINSIIESLNVSPYKPNSKPKRSPQVKSNSNSSQFTPPNLDNRNLTSLLPLVPTEENVIIDAEDAAKVISSFGK